jgi:hypothetical protein
VAIINITAQIPCGNVNPKNNTFIIQVPSVPATFIVPLVPNSYPTIAAMFAELIAAFAAAMPGMVVSVNDLGNGFRLTYGTPFYIDPQSPAVLYGTNVYGFPISTTPLNVVVGERASFTFSAVYHLQSKALVKYQKNQNSSSNPRTAGSLITIRNNFITQAPKIEYAPAAGFIFKNYIPETQINELDFEFTDEWGDSPIDYTDSPTTWTLLIDILTYT